MCTFCRGDRELIYFLCMKCSVLCWLNWWQSIISGTLDSSREVCKICSISAFPNLEGPPGELQKEAGHCKFLQVHFQAPPPPLLSTCLDCTSFFCEGEKKPSSSEFSLLALNLLSQKDARRWYVKANNKSQIPCLEISPPCPKHWHWHWQILHYQ